MEIIELRHLSNMSQRKFGTFLGIPIGTIRNWEQGISKPPEYVFHMIINSIRRDKMINVETIKFVNMLNKLAELTENGIEKFSKASSGTYQTKLFFDEKTKDENSQYKVVLDACVIDDPKCEHHYVISYYDTDSNEYSVRVVIDEHNKPYVLVRLTVSEDEVIIENGRWYFA